MGRKDARCVVKGEVTHAVAFFVHQIGPFIVRRQINVAWLVIGTGFFDVNAGQLARFIVDAQDPDPFVANLAPLGRNKEIFSRMVQETFMGMGHAGFRKTFKMFYINGSTQFPIRQDGQTRHSAALKGRHKKELVVEARRNVDRVPAFGTDRIEEGQAAVIFDLKSTHIVIIAMHRIKKGFCSVKSEKGWIFKDFCYPFERPLAMIGHFVAGNPFSPGITFFCRSASYISKHGVSPFLRFGQKFFRIAQFAASKKDISFKVAHFESCLEGKALRFVRHNEFAVFQGFPQIFDG